MFLNAADGAERHARASYPQQQAGLEMHSLRRSYATVLAAAMNAGGLLNAELIASLMGRARGTLALDSTRVALAWTRLGTL